MTPTIRVSEATYEFLKERAEPFVDTPDSVLRRLLGLDPGNGNAPEDPTGGSGVVADRSSDDERPRSARRHSRGRSDGKAKRTRAPRGSLLDEETYEVPILQVLAERGGRAPAREVLDALEPLLADRLKPMDRERIASGDIRWRNRAQFVRLRL